MGSSVNTTVFGHLKWARMARQWSIRSRSVAAAPLERDEGARALAPLGVRPRDHGGLEHGGVAVQGALDLDRGDVLAARDDDVLGAVLDLDVAVLVHHAEIAGVKPAALEGGCGGFGILQVALHDVVAAHHDLADGLAVARHRGHGRGIHHLEAFEHRVAHALAGLQARPLGHGSASHASCQAHTVAGPYTSVRP